VRPKHCSDEQLLEYLDSESGAAARIGVRWHLSRCWRCRTRLNAIEAQVHSLLRAIDQHPFPPERIDAARERFFRSAAAVGDGSGARVRFPPRVIVPRILACIAASLSAFALWHLTPARVEPKSERPIPAAAAKAPPATPPPPEIPTFAPIPAKPRGDLRPQFDIDDLEVRALYALHQAGACLGGEVRLVQTDANHLELTGSVESDAKRGQISALISAMVPEGGIMVNLGTLAELRVADLPPAAGMTTADQGPSSLPEMPLEQVLIQGYSRLFPEEPPAEIEKRVVALSNEALRLTSVALDHAWAIRNLAARYPRARFDHLTGARAGMIYEMARDHAARFSEACLKLAMEASEPLGSLPDASANSRPAGGSFASWEDQSAAALRQAQGLDQDAHDLFAMTGKKVDQPAARARQFLAALREAAALLTAF
jgi:hypothetical protein